MKINAKIVGIGQTRSGTAKNSGRPYSFTPVSFSSPWDSLAQQFLRLLPLSPFTSVIESPFGYHLGFIWNKENIISSCLAA